MKKGFTLVELLAVLVIISLISLITSYSVYRYINSSKNTISSAEISAAISSAQMYYADNADELPDMIDGSQSSILIEDLINQGYLLESDYSEKARNNFKQVVVTYENNKYVYEVKGDND